MKTIALRIDDIGASTKVFERYSKKRFLNIGILRDRRLFGAWGPYSEMTPPLWDEVFALLSSSKAKLTVGVTASWVESNGDLTPFPEKFPEEAKKLKEGLDSGLIEIANHGLTHCVLKDRLFKPRLVGSNRKHHREFWDWLPDETHRAHLKMSQKILEDTFGSKITTLIPPGNVFSQSTVQACEDVGITVINCQNAQGKANSSKVKILGNENVLAFHDRELVLYGVDWLKNQLSQLGAETSHRFVREL